MADPAPATPPEGIPVEGPLTPPTAPGTPSAPPQDIVPYALEPEAPLPAPKQPKTAPRPLGDKSFVDDLPEDADLEHDPEVERALKGEPLEDDASEDADVADPQKEFVKPGGQPAIIAGIGAGLAGAAIVAAAIRTTHHWALAGLLALYLIILHSLSGVLAVAIVAHFEKLRVGRAELAAARMLCAVALAMLLLSLGQGSSTLITAPLGIIAYVAAVGVLFRIGLPRVLRVAAVHATLMAAVYFAMLLYAWAAGSSK